jgi:hypothetical protein
VPERVVGYLFEYDLLKVDRQGATIRYLNRIIKPSADAFETYVETEGVQTMSFPIASLKAAHESWQTANARNNARIYDVQKALLAAQASGDPDEVDLTKFDDIDEYFQKFGKGPHLLEYEFSPDTEEPVEYTREKCGRLSRYWRWTHKLTNAKVKRFASASGKGFDSGRLSKVLGQISERSHPLAYARAQRILFLNDSPCVHNSVEELIAVSIDRKELLRQQVRLPVFDVCSFFSS